jgi:hypothetical protein
MSRTLAATRRAPSQGEAFCDCNAGDSIGLLHMPGEPAVDFTSAVERLACSASAAFRALTPPAVGAAGIRNGAPMALRSEILISTGCGALPVPSWSENRRQ